MMSTRLAPSSFDRYRNHLTILAQELPVLQIIQRVGTHKGWWTTHRNWIQTYARFDPDRKPFVTLLYETTDAPQEICTVEIFEQVSAPSKRELFPLDSIPNMWARILKFPDDSKLSQLPHVLADPAGHPTVYRYRPGKRCTIRFDHPHSRTSYFAKMFRDDQGRLIHHEGEHIWNLAHQGGLGFSVAKPLKWDPDTHTLWQETIQGSPIIQKLKGKEGILLASRLGKAAATIPQSSLRPQTEFVGQQQMDRSAKYADDFRLRIPTLTDSLNRLLAQLSLIHEKHSHAPTFAIHGAPHAHQWLDDGMSLGLVDFDRFSMGDREVDVATFLTELEFEGQPRSDIESMQQSFLTAYESIAGPLSPSLLSAYRIHKCLAKAYKASRSVRPTGDDKAKKHLQAALNPL